MKKTVIKANKIDTSTAKAKVLRRENKLPAVLYGALVDSQSIVLDYNTFLKQFRVVGQSTVVDLDIDGEVTAVLINDIQFHPVTEKILHVDFYAINPKKPVTVTVQLHFEGDPLGVRTKGGIMVTEKSELIIKCLPKDLVSHIVVDINILDDIGKSIHVKDIKLSEDMEVLDNEDVVLVHIVAPKLAINLDEEESEEGEEGGEGEESGEGGSTEEGESTEG